MHLLCVAWAYDNPNIQPPTVKLRSSGLAASAYSWAISGALIMENVQSHNLDEEWQRLGGGEP